MATFSVYPNGDGVTPLAEKLATTSFKSVDDVIGTHCCEQVSGEPVLLPVGLLSAMCACTVLFFASMWYHDKLAAALKPFRLPPALVRRVVSAVRLSLFVAVVVLALRTPAAMQAPRPVHPDCRPRSGARLINEYGVRVMKLTDVQSADKLFCVRKGLHFVWPKMQVGHRVQPRNVKSPVQGKPIVLTQLSNSPLVYQVDNFVRLSPSVCVCVCVSLQGGANASARAQVSNAEIEEIIAYNRPRVFPSTVGFAGKRDPTRTSSTAWDHDTRASKAILQRTFGVLAMDFDARAADDMQVLNYKATGPGPRADGHGEWYKPHLDWFQQSDGFEGHVPTVNNGTNRFATMFLYLSDVDEGGYTVFPLSTSHEGYNGEKLVHDGTVNTPGYIANTDALRCCEASSAALKSTPKRGNAVLFYSQMANGTLDPHALHGGCPIVVRRFSFSKRLRDD